MSGNYTPSFDAQNATYTWQVSQLSTRDVSRFVPINYIVWPGIRLNVACFADNDFTTEKGTCISNILAMGYRRIIVDLYWNSQSNGGQWQLCPVLTPNGKDRTFRTTLSNQLTTTSLSSTSLNSTFVNETAASTGIPNITNQNQVNIKFRDVPLSTSALSSPVDNSTSTTGLPQVDAPSVEIGNYTCDPDYSLDYLFGVLRSMAQVTATNLAAHMNFITFDLHLAQGSSTDGSTPGDRGLLKSYVQRYLNLYTYTPPDLQDDRRNLNATWLEDNNLPVNYYTILTNSMGNYYTPDGWPTEYYLITQGYARRILFSIGTIDLDGMSYNAQSETAAIFAPGGLDQPWTNTSQCFLELTNATTATYNTSFSIYENSPTAPLNSTTAAALINCGVSYVLNQTLNNTLATNSEVYLNFLEETQWAWDVGEPANWTFGNSQDAQSWSCAAMTNLGRWKVQDCNARYHVACRVANQPYQWSITKETASYPQASVACDDGNSEYTFAVPESALQNHFLFQEMFRANHSIIWIDFNEINVQGCWVSGGADAPCNYNIDDKSSQTVIVPSVAALIILILFSMFVIIKLAAYRLEKSRKRRKKEFKKFAGVDYEGIPS